MFTHRFTDSVFGRKVELCVGDSKEFNLYMKSLKSKERVGNDSLGEMVADKYPCETNPKIRSTRYFLWLSSYDGSPAMISILVHECYHTMSAIMENLGIVEEAEGSEARAYYLDALVEQFLTVLEGRKNEQAD